MLNRQTLLITVATALALVGLFLFATNHPARVAASAVNPPPTAPLAQAVPQNTIQVLGTFIAPNQATLTFKGSGRISEIRVQEGAQVKKGDTLAVLETTELQLQVQQAQAALAGAQARLDQAKAPATDADTTAAQAALDAALKNYEKVRAGPTVNDLAALKAQVDNAKAALDQAQSAYDRVGGATNPYSGLLPQSLQLQTATNNYNATVAAYNNARTHPTAAELAAAWGQVEQAQAALARLQPTSDNVAAAQAAVDQTQAALALAQQQVANATLTAPFDGTVIWLGPHVGEAAGPTTPILTLADLSHLQLQVGVDENSLELIQVGQTVSISPEAYKDKTVTGKVSRIGWLATTTAGVINVPVTIDVDATQVPLRPGLSASALIQVASK
jgi:HlyD family secretion protein